MVIALPRPVQLKLEQTLGQWRQWRCDPPLSAMPQVRRLLGAGHSNYSVLAASGSEYVVRIDGIDPSDHGLNRQGEWRIMQSAAAQGLAPRPCYFNPDLGSLVSEYLPPQADVTEDPKQVAALLRAIHRLPATHNRLDLGERIRRYEKASTRTGDNGRSIVAEFTDAVRHCLARRTAATQRRTLCHNDLLRANRVHSGGRLWAIDWEYSAMGDPLYDLAVVTCGDDLSQDHARRLLENYLQRSADTAEHTALLDYSAVYRYLELLWYLAQDHPQLNDARLEKSVRGLKQSLEEAGY